MHIKIITLLLVLISFTSLNAQELLTKPEAVALALEHNYNIKIVSNNVDIAKNNTSVLNSGYLPIVTGLAGATYNLDNTEAGFSDGRPSASINGAESSRYNASVNLGYTLFDGLGRRYNYKRLKEEHALSKLEARETIENTISQLFAVYYNVAKLSENAGALQQTLHISKDRLLRAQYQFEYGQNTKLGILNAQVDINNDSIKLILANQSLKNSKRDLNVVLGNALSTEFKVDTLVSFLKTLDRTDLLEKTKSNNVTLLQVDKSINISEFDIKTGQSAYLPTVGLSGSYGWNENDNNATSIIAVNTTTGLSGGVNLSWNIFDGGATNTRVKNAKINLENQEFQKEQILISIERDFNNIWDEYQNKLLVYYIQEDNILTAKNNFERTQEKFKIGQVTSIEFRQAQLNLLNAELSRNQAKYDAKLSELLVLQLSGDLLNVDY